MPILHVALAPAQIAADEFDQGGRILLEARAFLGQHAHPIAGAPHQHGFDLVMTEHMTFHQCAARQHRQFTMRHERRDAHDGVMAPIRPAITLPPCAADGVGAHPQAHPELEDAGKGAGRGHADDQALQDAEPRIDLHDAHELEQEIDRHDAVGVEHDGEVVVLAPALAEIRDVASLEADIVGAKPVGQRDPAVPCRCERGKACALGRGDLRPAGVAQHVDMKARPHAPRGQHLHHRLEQPRHPLGRFVADTQQDRGGSGDRLIPAHAAGNRRHGCDGVAREAHDQKADGRVPETDHVPGQRHDEQRQQNEVEGAEPAGRERDGGDPDQAEDRQSDAQEKQRGSPCGHGGKRGDHELVAGGGFQHHGALRVLLGEGIATCLQVQSSSGAFIIRTA
jgi:hypothetical protein